MLKNTSIICFSKEWSEDPTSNNHVLMRLAKHNKVLWINSIATRTPDFTDSKDLGRMWRKIGSFFKGPVEVKPNLWVYTPIVLPFPHSKIATKANKQILDATLKVLQIKLGLKRPQLWSFLPNAAEYLGVKGKDFSVYYCTDDFSSFDHLGGEKIAQKEREIINRADLVFATSNSLKEQKSKQNKETHLASHGVDYEHFAQAMNESTQIADELSDIEGPIVGFFGLLHTWIDQDLILKIATKHPQWTIVIIGKADVSIDKLEGIDNIKILGRRPYETLPSYCKGFSVGIIPFIVNELTHHVNPIKLREYLSAGLPVVSTSLPEVAYYSEQCSVAKDHDEFLGYLEKAIETDSEKKREARSNQMKNESWDAKVNQLSATVAKVSSKLGF